jgi:hypothetical protein
MLHRGLTILQCLPGLLRGYDYVTNWVESYFITAETGLYI